MSNSFNFYQKMINVQFWKVPDNLVKPGTPHSFPKILDLKKRLQRDYGYMVF